MALVLALCTVIKYFFAEADSRQLDWLLRPTSHLVAWFSHLHFVSWDTFGYYNEMQRILIAPACSGLNFFLILLATGACLVVTSLACSARQILWLAGTALAAYGLTLMVNTMRILLAIFLYQQNLGIGPISPERLHRIEGVVIYYVCLCAFVMLLSCLLHKKRENKKMHPLPEADSPVLLFRMPPGLGFRILLPLGCYLLFTLILPLLNGAAGKAPRIFAEHSLTVLLISLGFSLGLYCLFRYRYSGPRRLKNTQQHETKNTYY